MIKNLKINNHRDNNKDKISNPTLHYLVLSLIFGVGALTLASHTFAHAITERHHEDDAHHVVSSECTGDPTKNYDLVFNETDVSSSSISLDKCDQVTVKNNAPELVEVAMGPHDHHTNVEGFEETALKNGEAYSFRLAQSGTYLIHDHDNEKLAATIVVR